MRKSASVGCLEEHVVWSWSDVTPPCVTILWHYNDIVECQGVIFWPISKCQSFFFRSGSLYRMVFPRVVIYRAWGSKYQLFQEPKRSIWLNSTETCYQKEFVSVPQQRLRKRRCCDEGVSTWVTSLSKAHYSIIQVHRPEPWRTTSNLSFTSLAIDNDFTPSVSKLTSFYILTPGCLLQKSPKFRHF